MVLGWHKEDNSTQHNTTQQTKVVTNFTYKHIKSKSKDTRESVKHEWMIIASKDLQKKKKNFEKKF